MTSIAGAPTSPDVSPGRWFTLRAHRSPTRVAITFDGRSRTFGEMSDRIDRLAEVLRRGGMKPGDRVGFVGANHAVAYEALFAASRLGAIFVPINSRLTPGEAAHLARDAGLHTLLHRDSHRSHLDAFHDAGVRRLLSVDGGHPGDEDLEPAIADADPIADVAVHADDDVAVIIYTSGTTGPPKGAMLTNANLWWNNVNAMHALDVPENEVALVAAPIFHIAGINGLTLRTWQKGGQVVLLEKFDPAQVLQLIPAEGVTTMFGVPTMLRAMATRPEFASTDLSSVRTMLCSAAPVPLTLLRTYEARGIGIHQGYGLTEAAPVVTMLGAEWARSKIGSAGLPPMFTEIRLVGHDGARLAGSGVIGEICVRGPNVMKGYWNQPVETAKAIDPDGWLHTGDVGRLDEDGFLYVVDRMKDLIISGGENIYPAEIEDALFAHPAVADVAVIGVADEHWGERVVAVIVPEAGSEITLARLRTFLAGRLADYKHPKEVRVIAELPRNAAGKVAKEQLRETGLNAVR